MNFTCSANYLKYDYVVLTLIIFKARNTAHHLHPTPISQSQCTYRKSELKSGHCYPLITVVGGLNDLCKK